MKSQELINFISLLTVFIVTLGSSCEKISYPKSSVKVANNAGHNIEFYLALGGKEGIVYPDTVLPTGLKPPFQVAQAGEIGYRDFGFSEEKIFEGIPSDTLSIYIFHPDTLSKYDWETIIEAYNILKRYDLSFEDLERINFTVTYPPNDDMKGIKMYPK